RGALFCGVCAHIARETHVIYCAETRVDREPIVSSCESIQAWPIRRTPTRSAASARQAVGGPAPAQARRELRVDAWFEVLLLLISILVFVAILSFLGPLVMRAAAAPQDAGEDARPPMCVPDES